VELVNGSKQYNTVGRVVYSCQYHVIFCPKYRRHVLVGKIEQRLKELIKQKETEYHFEVLEMEVKPDHVHLLLDVNPKFGIYDIVNHIKGFTSHELRKEFKELRTKLPTLWTRSKFISSVGAVTLDVVKRYIEEQKGKRY